MSEFNKFQQVFQSCNTALLNRTAGDSRTSDGYPDGQYTLKHVSNDADEYSPKDSDVVYPSYQMGFEITSGPDQGLIGKPVRKTFRLGPNARDGKSYDAGDLCKMYRKLFAEEVPLTTDDETGDEVPDMEEVIGRIWQEGVGAEWTAIFKTKNDYQNIRLNKLVG
jgi:hypothetical protein